MPLLLFSFTVSCRIVFAKPEDPETWPNHLYFRFLTKVIFSKAAWNFSISCQIKVTTVALLSVFLKLVFQSALKYQMSYLGEVREGNTPPCFFFCFFLFFFLAILQRSRILVAPCLLPCTTKFLVTKAKENNATAFSESVYPFILKFP